MGYTSLAIENFRSIKKMEMKNLKRINILVGRNNSGKSTILEAFFLLAGLGNPKLALNIHNFRNLPIERDKDFEVMFHYLDFKTPITLSGEINGKKRKAVIKPHYENGSKKIGLHKKPDGNSPDLSEMSSYLTTKRDSVLDGLETNFILGGRHFTSMISIKKDDWELPKQYHEEIEATFLTPRNLLLPNPKIIDKLTVQKRLSEVTSVLQEIEPKLSDIRLTTDGAIRVDLGEKKLMPINILGDGIRRVVSILSTFAKIENGIFIIDEIENGFHHHTMSILWKAILAACELYNVQLIATTHSYECVQSLAELCEQDKKRNREIQLYRIDREEETHEAKSVGFPVLLGMLEKNWEFR